jgi:hypothetical protein
VTYSFLPLALAARAASLRPGHRQYSVDLAASPPTNKIDNATATEFFQTREDHNGAPLRL